MTPDQRLRDMVTDNPRFLHPMITDDVRLLLAERDRYEAALRWIAALRERCADPGVSSLELLDVATKIAREALRCE